MKLLIDVGNTRLKLASMQGRELRPLTPVRHAECDIDSILERYRQDAGVPGQVYVANVAGEAVARGIRDYCARHWRINAVFVQVAREFDGLVTDYRDTGQLGVDRWLAVIAAWRRVHAPVCVVDCGTAITIDLVSSVGRHTGGYILPGADLMQRSLLEGTSGIRTGIDNTLGLEPGCTTRACIANGAARAITSAIESTLREQRRIQNNADVRLIMTGGGTEAVAALINESHEIVPALVLEGLAAVAA